MAQSRKSKASRTGGPRSERPKDAIVHRDLAFEPGPGPTPPRIAGELVTSPCDVAKR